MSPTLSKASDTVGGISPLCFQAPCSRGHWLISVYRARMAAFRRLILIAQLALPFLYLATKFWASTGSDCVFPILVI